MRSELSQRQEQRLAMTPAMLQSIEVLQLTTAELLERIDEELARNETLAVSPPERGERSACRAEAGDDRYELLQQLAAPGPDLREHIHMQLAWLDLDAELESLVLAMVERLDARGYLTATDDELIAELGSDRATEARAVLASLEPGGLGASGPIEAMLAQLDPNDPDAPTIECILTRYLDDLARQRVPDVARALGLHERDVRSLLERIAVLDPRPGARFHERPAMAMRPELAVRERGGRLEVVVDDESLPVLELNGDYVELAETVDVDPEVRQYLRDKLQSAATLMRAVEQRRRTLLRIGAAVFTEQRAFLRRGEIAIRPLRMSDIARRVGMHVSTVSRAVAGKSVSTVQGIHELRAFFDGGRVAGGKAGRRAVLAQLRAIVDSEDPERPCSDDDLCALLRAQGLDVARRTVAKYRAELGLPAASARRRGA